MIKIIGNGEMMESSLISYFSIFLGNEKINIFFAGEGKRSDNVKHF